MPFSKERAKLKIAQSKQRQLHSPDKVKTQNRSVKTALTVLMVERYFARKLKIAQSKIVLTVTWYSAIFLEKGKNCKYLGE